MKRRQIEPSQIITRSTARKLATLQAMTVIPQPAPWILKEREKEKQKEKEEVIVISSHE